MTALHRIVGRPLAATELEPDYFRIEWADPLRCPPTYTDSDGLARLLRRFDTFATPVTVHRLESL